MAQNDPHYVPAFGLHGLTRYYDAFAKLVNPLPQRLLQQADIQPGQRLLDLGCGTGLLTLMIKRSVPEAQVTGLDADEEVLKIAREKSHGADIQWDHAFAFDMPYPDQPFDVVVSSFVTHHLTARINCARSGKSTASFAPLAASISWTLVHPSIFSPASRHR